MMGAGQIGTNELQSEIRKDLKSLGWSVRIFADVIFEEVYGDDGAEDMSVFYEKIKKHLSRKTTPPEKLIKYVDILRRHPDYKSVLGVTPIFVNSGELNKDFLNKMSDISKNISRGVVLD